MQISLLKLRSPSAAAAGWPCSEKLEAVSQDRRGTSATSLARRGGVDFTGLVLVALGLGAMQIVLDRGQEDDWLQSHFILALTMISVVALVCFVFWEIRQKRPVVDLRLLRNSNFAVTNAMMFSVGIVLYGSTVLIPQYLQGLMGYSAQLAGMALSPGGFA